LERKCQKQHRSNRTSPHSLIVSGDGVSYSGVLASRKLPLPVAAVDHPSGFKPLSLPWPGITGTHSEPEALRLARRPQFRHSNLCQHQLSHQPDARSALAPCRHTRESCSDSEHRADDEQRRRHRDGPERS